MTEPITETLSFDAIELERLRRENTLQREALRAIQRCVQFCLWDEGLCPECQRSITHLVCQGLEEGST